MLFFGGIMKISKKYRASGKFNVLFISALYDIPVVSTVDKSPIIWYMVFLDTS